MENSASETLDRMQAELKDLNMYIDEVDPDLSKKFKLKEKHLYTDDDDPHTPATEKYRKAWSRNWERNDNT